jgi:predicted  nucleic acid-binding Zn-ribbon protein
MGPTNVALVKLFRADQALREAQERLDAASKNVRVQERRVNDLTEKLKVAQTTLREAQSRAKQLELDQASRDAQIDKLRTQQSVAKNHKEYQAFLIEINTQKVDRAKVEEDQLKVEEALDKARAEVAGLTSQSESERSRLASMKEQIGETLASHHAEVDSLRPAREGAATALPARLRETFERLAEHHDGEAMSAISKPDRRKEEYLCTACNMELARDVYNKLHSRDEIIYCPSCRRILYIPDDLPPEEAIGTGRPAPKAAKAPVVRKARTAKKKPASAAGTTPSTGPAASTPEESSDDVIIEPRAKGKLGEALSRAQGETVSSAMAGGQNPIECEVFINGELAGIYKAQAPDKLERAIKFYMSQAKLEGAIEVKPLAKEAPAVAPVIEPAAAQTPEPPPAAEPAALEPAAPIVQTEVPATDPPAAAIVTTPEPVSAVPEPVSVDLPDSPAVSDAPPADTGPAASENTIREPAHAESASKV